MSDWNFPISYPVKYPVGYPVMDVYGSTGGFTPEALPSLTAWWDPSYQVLTDGATVHDGNDANYLNRASSVLLDITGDFTMAGWVYVTGNPVAFGGLVAKGSAFYNLMITSSRALRWELRTGAGYQTFLTSLTPALNTWAFVVAQYDSTNNLLKVSMNNGAFQTQATTGTPLTSTDVFEIGIRDSGTVPTFALTGRMDGWGVWQRLLSASEITAEYNSGAGVNVPAASGYSVYYKFNQTGTRLDYSSNALNLTQTGTIAMVAGLISGSANSGDSVSVWIARNAALDLTPVSIATRPTYQEGGGTPYVAISGAQGLTSTLTMTGAYTLAMGGSQTSGGLRMFNSLTQNSLTSLSRDPLKAFVGSTITSQAGQYTGPHSTILTKASGGNHAYYVDAVNITTASVSTDFGLMTIGYNTTNPEAFAGNCADAVVTGALVTAVEIASLDTFLRARAT